MKMPAFQFYPADWRKDPGVQSLSRHDRSVWFDMLCIMHESDERGVLVLNRRPMPEPALASMLGLDNQTFNQTLTTILTYGVASRRESDGALFSRRMVKDENLCQLRRLAGKKGGNPNLVNQKSKQKPTTKVNQILTPSSSASSSNTTSDDVVFEASSPAPKLSADLQAHLATLTDTSGEVPAEHGPLSNPARFQAICDELRLGAIDHEHYRQMALLAAKGKPQRTYRQWESWIANFFTNRKQGGPLLQAKTAQLSAPTPLDQLPLPGKEQRGQVIVIAGIDSDASMNRMKLTSAQQKWPTAIVHAFIPGQRHD